MIILMSTNYYMTYISHEFFSVMFVENLAQNCHHVVFRIIEDPNPIPKQTDTFPFLNMFLYGPDGPERMYHRGKLNVDKVMEMYGFVKEKIQAKVCKSQSIYTIVLILYLYVRGHGKPFDPS